MPSKAKPKILFIDDEQNILQGLERSLRPMRRKWNMSFVSNGAESIKRARTEPYQVLVSDLCMPGMSGTEVLKHFRETYPNTVRIVLSGQTDRDAFWEAIGLAHIFIGKPCKSQVLESIISRAIAAQCLLPNPALRRIVSQIEFVPFYPDNWRHLVEETEAESPNLEKIADIIYRDVGMSAKVLQIANSIYFGVPHLFTNAKQAVNSLTIEGIKALVNYYRALLDKNEFDLPIVLFDTIRQRCYLAGLVAQEMAEERNRKGVWRENAFLVGLLHGLGEIILMNYNLDQYRWALRYSEDEHVPLWEAESKIFGCTHVQITVFLLTMWGIPAEICDALTYYHRPRESGETEFGLLTVAHAAATLAAGLLPFSTNHPGNPIDVEYLDNTGLTRFLPAWRELSQKLYREKVSIICSG